jgi:dethiobiotin synthetase
VKREIIFVTGIGTGIGKTVVSAILAEALEADYWKPIQSGMTETTDTDTVRTLVSNTKTRFWEEAFRLQTPASPHLSARIDNVHIDLEDILRSFEEQHNPARHVIIEGAGGLMVPINEKHFYPDLIPLLHAKVIVVSGQYLGNINHSLLTAEVLKNKQLPVVGWIFNGTYHINEEDIIRWSGLERIGRIEQEDLIDRAVVKRYAKKIKPDLLALLGKAD